MSSKRTASESDKAGGGHTGGNGQTEPASTYFGGSGPKRPKALLQSTYTASNAEELAINGLRQANKCLTSIHKVKDKTETDLRNRIEQLEKKQTNAEAIVFVISRYWNQLNEDMRVLLQRFDAETSDENEVDNESDATKTFLASLEAWEDEEILQQRVESSTRALRKIVTAFDHVVQRNGKVTAALKSESEQPLDQAVLAHNVELERENKRMHELLTELHAKQRTTDLLITERTDEAEHLRTQNEELRNRIEDVTFELQIVRNREQRLEDALGEAQNKLREMQNADAGEGGQMTKAATISGKRDSVSSQKLDDLQKDLDEQRVLAATRLSELEELNNKYVETLKEVEQLKMELKFLPDSVIKETSEYKTLQSSFSVLFNESMQLKQQLEETRQLLQNSKNNHLRQIEHMESEELNMQKRLRTEVIQLEDHLAQVRREHDMLQLDFNQMLAANEQTGPINREMRHLITSLQNHNTQLKGEVNRWKKRQKEAAHEGQKYKEAFEQCQKKLHAERERAHSVSHASTSNHAGGGDQAIKADPKQESKPESKPDAATQDQADIKPKIKEEPKVEEPPHLDRQQSGSQDSHDSKPAPTHPQPTASHQPQPSHSLSSQQRAEFEQRIRDYEKKNSDLKQQLKKAVDQYQEKKLMCEAYKNVAKETREKVQLMASEKKLRLDIEELRKQLAAVPAAGGSSGGPVKYTEVIGADGRKRRLTEEEAAREIQRLKDNCVSLQKQLTNQKQEDEALISEMELTGTAFEDMQDQNLRLTQQLREKDDANFKLMSERIKSQQIQKLLKEEKESLQEQVISLQSQVESQNQVVRKLEEKERLLQNNLSTIEKELTLKQSAMESHKRKAVESAQSAADLKLHLEKYLTQLKEAQSTVAEKTSALQHAAYETRRLKENVIAMERKYERAKKFELATTADEVLMEEIKEYKSQLTCPSCKTRRKDAVLTKCFHVFCYDCIKTRYDTRQRKCPKCNQGFGQHDFHKLYLA